MRGAPRGMARAAVGIPACRFVQLPAIIRGGGLGSQGSEGRFAGSYTITSLFRLLLSTSRLRVNCVNVGKLYWHTTDLQTDRSPGLLIAAERMNNP